MLTGEGTAATLSGSSLGAVQAADSTYKAQEGGSQWWQAPGSWSQLLTPSEANSLWADLGLSFPRRSFSFGTRVQALQFLNPFALIMSQMSRQLEWRGGEEQDLGCPGLSVSAISPRWDVLLGAEALTLAGLSRKHCELASSCRPLRSLGRPALPEHL